MASQGSKKAPRTLPQPLARQAMRLMKRFVFDADLPVEKQRARLDMIGSSTPPPKGFDVGPRAIGGVPGESVRVSGSTPERTVLHLHGGGYIVGSPVTVRGWAVAIAASVGGVEVVSPDYRLAPEHPFPAALDDAAAVWKELTSSVDPGSVVLSGDSAGAGLALAFAARLRDEGAPLPAGLILISPWLDLTVDRSVETDLVAVDPLLTPAWLAGAARDYAAGTDLADPGISPLLGSLADLPPILVQAGADDILVPDSLRLARAVKAAGGDITLSIGNDLWHDFPLQAGMIAAADGAVRQAAAFLDRVLP